MPFNPKYKQIANQIKTMIDHGVIGADAPIPTEAELCKRFSVSRSTVTKALDELRYINVIYTVHGSGSYVDSRYISSPHADFSNIISIILPFADYNRSSRIDETIILKNLEKQLSKNRFFPMVHYCQDDCDSFYESVKKMQALPHEGMIAYTPRDASLLPKKYPDIYSLLSTQPTILFDQNIPGIDLPCIHSNFFYDTYIATTHLLDCGYTRLFFFSAVSINYNSSIQERYAGFKKAIKKKNADRSEQYIYIQTTGDTVDRTRNIEHLTEVIRRLAEQYPNDRLGFACYCDYMGFEAYSACKLLGLRVPEDVGIIGLGNIKQPLEDGKELTTVDYDYQKCSEVAVKTLVYMIQKRDCPTALQTIGKLIPGDTTKKPEYI